MCHRAYLLVWSLLIFHFPSFYWVFILSLLLYFLMRLALSALNSYCFYYLGIDSLNFSPGRWPDRICLWACVRCPGGYCSSDLPVQVLVVTASFASRLVKLYVGVCKENRFITPFIYNLLLILHHWSPSLYLFLQNKKARRWSARPSRTRVGPPSSASARRPSWASGSGRARRQYVRSSRWRRTGSPPWCSSMRWTPCSASAAATRTRPRAGLRYSMHNKYCTCAVFIFAGAWYGSLSSSAVLAFERSLSHRLQYFLFLLLSMKILFILDHCVDGVYGAARRRRYQPDGACRNSWRHKSPRGAGRGGAAQIRETYLHPAARCGESRAAAADAAEWRQARPAGGGLRRAGAQDRWVLRYYFRFLHNISFIHWRDYWREQIWFRSMRINYLRDFNFAISLFLKHAWRLSCWYFALCRTDNFMFCRTLFIFIHSLFAGADIRSLCQEASMGPVREVAQQRSGDLQSIDAQCMPAIALCHFEDAFEAVMPSVSASDLHRYVEWNNSFGSFRKMVWF